MKMDYEFLNLTTLGDDDKPALILYRYRWLVLFSYFLSSSAIGVVQASLSTNRTIVDNVFDEADYTLL